MKNKELIKTLYECAAACNHCADACLDEYELGKMIACIRLDRECASICECTARLLAEDRIEITQMLRVCEDLCRRCADECGKHAMDHCKHCANACKECASACAAA